MDKAIMRFAARGCILEPRLESNEGAGLAGLEARR
jgi:hypothetical protein